MELLSSLASAIGWIVLICVVLMVVSKILSSVNEERMRESSDLFNPLQEAYKLALRHIYFESSDDGVKEMAKQMAMNVGIGWAFLELEMSDAEFESHRIRSGYEKHYFEARRRIKENGYPIVLEDGVLKFKW